MNNQKVLVRTENAGVFYGEIELRTGNEVIMRNTRRIWYWSGAFTLSALATRGTSDPDSCKFSCYVDSITLLGVIEIIPCTKEAIKSIDGVREWLA